MAHVLYRADWWYAVKVTSLNGRTAGGKMLFNDDIGWVGDLDMVLDLE